MLFLVFLACGGSGEGSTTAPQPAPVTNPGPPPALVASPPVVPVVPEQKNPFSVVVEPLEMAPGESGAARLVLRVPAGTYLYRDATRIQVLADGEMDMGEADYPPGVMRFDEAFGREREVWELDAVVELPLTAPKSVGTHTVTLAIDYQGCKGGLCFMPQHEEHSVTVQVQEGA
ncbi:MAG: protein-disulfide reductase DsbD N-terminal domain-containing protein [Myxococcota bacterium]|nr:protein-disulfide reductase DsbD N-terminal domain-containing protein [Myxococcota bacterium]